MASCSRSNDGNYVTVAPLAEIACQAITMPVSEADTYFITNTVDYGIELDALEKVCQYENSLEWLNSPAVKAFASATDTLAPTSKSVNESLSHILNKSQDNGLDIHRKAYATVIWGKMNSIIFCDSVMLIALNHYLGENFEGYSGMPAYIRQTKTAEALPYDMAEALTATSYPYSADDNNALINHMIYDGIITKIKLSLVKDSNLAAALGYNKEQLNWAEKHESEIWKKLVSTKVIFETSQSVVNKFLLPAPACPEISQECPGRIGRYIGYKIVESYLKNHRDIGLNELVTGDFYKLKNPLTEAYYQP